MTFFLALSIFALLHLPKTLDARLQGNTTRLLQECSRPRGWCSHKGASYFKADCNADGIEDHVCLDSIGQRGTILSGSCVSVWPNANINSCPNLDGAFTIVFISDMETEYRGHTRDFCKGVVGFVKDLASKGLKYDGYYSDVSIGKPELVIHGGDISDGEYGTWVKETNAVDVLYSSVWQQLYDAGIPMISAIGNHDNDPKYTVETCEKSNNFVRKSYEKTEDLVGNSFSYIEIPPTTSRGQSLFKAKYKGVQIASLGNMAFYNDEDDIQFDQLKEELRDLDKPTLFVSHQDTRFYSSSKRDELKDLISSFPEAVLLSGHTHVLNEITYNGWKNYVAAYPHLWEKEDSSGEYFDAGMFAVLFSPKGGILQIKNVKIPYQEVTGCWPDGTVCGQGTTCGNCCHEARDALMTKCGGPKWSDGTICADGTTCDACQNSFSYWYSKAITACGSEPKRPDGTICADGTTCNACQNPFSYWYSKAITACGSEPKWPDGTVCALGTTCNACQNPATYWPGKVITACGNEPCWGRGTFCGPGTTCNSCCNGSSWFRCS